MEVLQSGIGELIQPPDLHAFRQWNRQKTKSLVDKRMTEAEAVSRFIHDGDYIGTELYGTVRCPMSLVYEIVRQGVKDLRLVGQGVFESDMLLAAGLVKALDITNEGDPKEDRSLDPDVSIIRNGFATPSFHLGSHGFDTTAKVVWQARQQVWQGVVFANHPMARIGMDGKSNHAKGNYISFPFKTIQDRNVMVTMKWGPVTDPGVDKKLWIYFSSALDRVEEEQGWIFVKFGNAFAGVKVVDGYEWVTPWSHRDAINPKSYVRMLHEKSPVIMVANDAADYGNDFAVFTKALIAEPVSWKDGVCQFATITHEGPLKAGKIAGKPVEYQPSL